MNKELQERFNDIFNYDRLCVKYMYLDLTSLKSTKQLIAEQLIAATHADL